MHRRRILDRLALIVVTATTMAGCAFGDDSTESTGTSKVQDRGSSVMPSGSPEPPSGRKPGGSIRTERIGVMHDVWRDWCHDDMTSPGSPDSIVRTGLPSITAWTPLGTTDAEQSAVSRSLYVHNSVCAASARVARERPFDLPSPLPDGIPDNRCVVWGKIGISYGQEVQSSTPRLEEPLPEVDFNTPRVRIEGNEHAAPTRKKKVPEISGNRVWQWVWAMVPEIGGPVTLYVDGHGAVAHLHLSGLSVTPEGADGMKIHTSASNPHVVPECSWKVPTFPPGESGPPTPEPSESPGTIHVRNNSTYAIGSANTALDLPASRPQERSARPTRSLGTLCR